MNIIANDTLEPGIEIASNDSEHEIASWPAKKGGYYAKVFFDSGNSNAWQAVSNAQYKGPGLIVFIQEKPALGQKLQITKVSTTVAFAKIA